MTTTQKLDDKEKALLAAEMEVHTLNRKSAHAHTHIFNQVQFQQQYSNIKKFSTIVGDSTLSFQFEYLICHRRVQHLEGDLEMCEDKMLVATQKLDKVIMIAIARIRIVRY